MRIRSKPPSRGRPVQQVPTFGALLPATPSGTRAESFGKVRVVNE